ncbi:glycosyltransferase [Kluyvera intermedia]|uniref:glycosyltransferase n=1 Tax=Kluyvera intermedia TaxID=61648 RepID=UPI001F348500|nr:glycosyltransferase [Kluyvera intermedia]EKU4733098.1 glycosyltransferase [Kluyvera ascorbata]MCE9891459.1 glycosyltransferase [Kluyvera intermedia]
MNFSVLMSLYNQESPEHLDLCLDSLSKQSLQATEIVMVLDGPISEPLHLILNRWLKSLPLKIVPLSECVGLGNALNIGLKYCDSNYIARMDTDDICDVNRFQLQIEYLKSHENVALIGGAIEEFKCQVHDLNIIRFSKNKHDEIFKYAKFRNPFNHMTVIFKKDVIESIGGYKHHLYMEDYNLWLRLLSGGYQTYNLSEVLVFTRIGNGMISRRKGWSYIKSEFLISKLKYELAIDGVIHAFYIFLIRALPRLLPTFFLMRIYSILRGKY